MLDPREVLTALGVDHVNEVAPFSGGWGTALWKVRLDDRSYALRVFGPGAFRARDREAWLMRLAAAAGIPVPEVHAAGAWTDRPALLVSWCAGRTLVDELRENPARARELGVALGRVQARIHQIRVPLLPGEKPDAWMDWAGTTEPTLRARLRAMSRDDDRLLHLDYHPLNVLVDDRGVSGVIDWTNARAGDPRADVARTDTILRILPLPREMAAVLDPRTRARLARAYRDGYREVAGPFVDLAPFLAWAGAALVDDLAPRVGQPGFWLTNAHLAQIARLTGRWRRRIGIGDA